MSDRIRSGTAGEEESIAIANEISSMCEEYMGKINVLHSKLKDIKIKPQLANLADILKNAARGIVVPEGIEIKYSYLVDNINSYVDEYHLEEALKNIIVNALEAVKARDANDGEVMDGIVYEAENIIIATGSRPYMPNIKGADSKNVLDSDAMLSMDVLPASMIIIGGGVIGIEFAVLLSELGCKVTIIEMMKDILFMADDDVIKEIKKILINNKVELITSAKVVEIRNNEVFFEREGKLSSAASEKILVAVGRVPNSDEAELERLGIRHEKGRIITDDNMRTSAEGIYAIGDVNGKFMLAHVASEEGIVAVENIFGHNAVMKYNAIPQCIYSHPEIACKPDSGEGA